MEKKNDPCAFSLGYTFSAEPSEVSPLLVLTQAEPAHSDSIHRLGAPKIPRRETHNKFRLQVRVPAGYKLEHEQLGVDVGGARECTSLETI